MNPPKSVIPISLGRPQTALVRNVPGRAGNGVPARPVRVLVAGGSSADRQRLCRLGEQAAGPGSRWIEAADHAAAAWMLASFDFDLVVACSAGAGDGLEWAKPGGDQPKPLLALFDSEDQPGRIHQVLDSGAEVLLSPRLPESMLRAELYALTAKSAKRLQRLGAHPIAFPKGICS